MPPRGATQANCGLVQAAMFRSTPLAQGRHDEGGDDAEAGRVSIHAPARGATSWPHRDHDRLWCFDPRPCARGDSAMASRSLSDAVSIHAPARGATRTVASNAPRYVGFDPRPCARGDSVPESAGDFDPRPCARGADDFRIGVAPRGGDRDAPARGATIRDLQFTHGRGIDPRPSREGRPGSKLACGASGGFDPRPCARGDHCGHVFPASEMPFRSTPCARGDQVVESWSTSTYDAVSIHAPARGATGPSVSHSAD